MNPAMTRRRLLRGALATLGVNAIAPLAAPSLFASLAHAAAKSGDDERILVILELSGGNDGLNTVVPHGDDAYYRLRPTIGIPRRALRPIDEMHGFNPGLAGFERLWRDGHLAIVQGCGYARPNFSHFTSMAYWHTAAPNSGDDYGWFGRTADALSPEPRPNLLINIDESQSLAVRSRLHTPVVFNDPEKFLRTGYQQERPLLDATGGVRDGNSSRAYLDEVARSAREASALVRKAWHDYATPVDYGIFPLGLDKVAACIAAGLPTRLYYTGYPHNAFDTHVHQPDLHQRLLTYTADAVLGFMRDLERLGQADRVCILAFSEFGRRAGENTSRGTDHGTANPMYVIGKRVRGGFHGERPSLTTLVDDGNLQHTTDFRRVYASAIEGWLGLDSQAVLKGQFPAFPLFT